MRIAVAQVITGSDLTENLGVIAEFTARAAGEGADVVVFPEAAMRAFGNSLVDIAEPLDGPWAGAVRDLAAQHDIVIVAGMFTPGSGGRVKNTLLATGRGVEVSYDKIHLFDAFGFAESDTVEPGVAPVVFELDGVTFGLATCYDVRFPALFQANARAGAQVNIVCASWGAGEGKIEQWELLTRARALDATTYVVACGQGDPASIGIEPRGAAPTGVGHSAVISPLGALVAGLGAEPELVVVEVDAAVVAGVREKLPVLVNARDLG